MEWHKDLERQKIESCEEQEMYRQMEYVQKYGEADLTEQTQVKSGSSLLK